MHSNHTWNPLSSHLQSQDQLAEPLFLHSAWFPEFSFQVSFSRISSSTFQTSITIRSLSTMSRRRTSSNKQLHLPQQLSVSSFSSTVVQEIENHRRTSIFPRTHLSYRQFVQRYSSNLFTSIISEESPSTSSSSSESVR